MLKIKDFCIDQDNLLKIDLKIYSKSLRLTYLTILNSF